MNKFFMKALSIITATFLLTGMLPFYAFANEVTLPSTVKYTIADGEVTITKCNCQTSSVDIVIPETIEGYPVTKINSGAFGNCFYHKHFTVPATVKKIGAAAFATNDLVSVTVDESNQYYSSDEYGLYNKDKTEYLQYFYGRKDTDFTVPESVKTIGMRAFEFSNLLRITLPEGLESIAQNAFNSCKKLTEIALPESLVTIESYAFQTCIALKEISIGAKVASIHSSSFSGTKVLEKITVSPDNTSFYNGDNGELYSKEDRALLHYPQGNTTDEIFIIPEGIEKITNAEPANSTIKHIHLPSTLDADKNLLLIFYGCTALEKFTVADDNPDYTTDEYGVLFDKDMVTLIACPVALPYTSYSTPSSVVSIGMYAFENSNLNDIKINEGVISIGGYAFQLCRNLKSITLPKTLTSISSAAFQSSPYIADVYYTGTQEEWNAINIQSANNYLLNADIHFNHGATNGSCGENVNWSYNETSGTLTLSGNGTVDEKQNFEEYGWYSFRDNIQYIEIDDGIVNVPANAFTGCTVLNEVYLGKDVTSVGENAFSGCENLRVFTSHADSLNIADGALNGCHSTITFAGKAENAGLISYAETIDATCIEVSFDEEEKILKFNGELTVYSAPRYSFLSKFLNEHLNANYIYFEKLIFDGVEPDVILPDFEGADSSAQQLTLSNLYVNLVVVRGDSQQSITFEEMLELLENGDYDAFKYVIDSDDIDTEKTFIQKVEDLFANLTNNALRAISSVINFIAKLFRKK